MNQFILGVLLRVISIKATERNISNVTTAKISEYVRKRIKDQGNRTMELIRWFKNSDGTYCVRQGMKTWLFVDKETAYEFYQTLRA